MSVLREIGWIVFLLIQALMAIYIALPALLLLSYGLVRLLGIRTPFQRKPYLTDKDFDFGLIITAHQETDFVPPLVDSILKQTYPHFQAYIIADDCPPGVLGFPDTRVSVLEPSPALHSKIKSIHYALDHFQRRHDAFIIVDVDNLLHPSFLETMNAYFRKGYKVVQADFKPKNTDTHFARLDAIGDMFNFFVEREARMRLGLSSAIWGAGIAIECDLYREIEYADLLGGFDKKLQAHLAQHVRRIAFAPEAILYDEKVITGQSLENQRTRWLNSYFKYFGESFAILLNGLKKADFNLVYFGYNTIRPPLFIVFGGALACLAVDYFVRPDLAIAWLLILLSFVLSFIVIVIMKGKTMRYLQTLVLMPLFVLRQVAALFKIKKAKRSFLKTRHERLIYIDDLVKGPAINVKPKLP